MKDKLIKDIDSEESNNIFKEIQDKYGVKDGGVDPLWLIELTRKIEENNGITEEELKKEVEDYYRLHGQKAVGDNQ